MPVRYCVALLSLQRSRILSDLLDSRGVTLEKLGRSNEAFVAYKRALEIEPNFAEVYNNLGSVLKNLGRLREAAEEFAKATEINPKFAFAYRNLGLTLRELGSIEDAKVAFSTALELKPDYVEVEHILSAISGVTTNKAPAEYIEGLFDFYADRFEKSLVEKLEYNIPKLLAYIMFDKSSTESLGNVTDLGCGTGLFGQEIYAKCKYLEGVDISKAMLNEARGKNVYDNLIHQEITEYLSEDRLNFDYFISSDVFIYVGDLAEVFALIKSRNKRSGKLVFSTEHSEKDGFKLLESGRFAHSKSYIQGLSDSLGFNMSHFSLTNLRKEKDKFIVGGLYVLEF